jgi:hypothetical protein
MARRQGYLGKEAAYRGVLTPCTRISTILDRTSYLLCGASVGRALGHFSIATRKRGQYIDAIPQLAAKPIELTRRFSGNRIAFQLSAEIRLQIDGRTQSF